MLQFLGAFSLVRETFSYFTIVCRFCLKKFFRPATPYGHLWMDTS